MCSLYRMVVFPAASRPSMTTCSTLASSGGSQPAPRRRPAEASPRLSYPHLFVPEQLVKHLPKGDAHLESAAIARIGAPLRESYGNLLFWLCRRSCH